MGLLVAGVPHSTRSLADSPTVASEADSLPSAPKYSVLDEPHVLSRSTFHSLEQLLVEHERLTGQRIVFAILDSLHGADPDDRARRMLGAWNLGKHEKDNGILVALYWKNREARIQIGYGLEDVLTDDQAEDIVKEDILPPLREGKANQAVRAGALGLLEAMDSPLVESGRDEQILGSPDSGQEQDERDEGSTASGSYAWLAWMALGMALLLITFNRLFTADAHFTGAGWFRPSPWRRRPGPGGEAPPEGGASAEW